MSLGLGEVEKTQHDKQFFLSLDFIFRLVGSYVSFVSEISTNRKSNSSSNKINQATRNSNKNITSVCSQEVTDP